MPQANQEKSIGTQLKEIIQSAFHSNKEPRFNARVNQYIFEREKTFISTARSSDAIRKGHITEKDHPPTYPRSLQHYLNIYHTHVQENPEGVYGQEDAPFLTADFSHRNSYTLAASESGTLRNHDVTVGDFDPIPAQNVTEVALRFFTQIDTLLQYAPFLNRIPAKQKLALLSLIDQVQTLGHFTGNASGRVNEDWMVSFAQKMGLLMTVSESGFRGQLDNEFEEQVEMGRWKMRIIAGAAVTGRKKDTKSSALLELEPLFATLDQLVSAAKQGNERLFNDALLQRELDPKYQDVMASQEEIFKEAQDRTYKFLPNELPLQKSITACVAHLVLADAQPYNPTEASPLDQAFLSPRSQHRSVTKIRQYILDHLTIAKNLIHRLSTSAISSTHENNDILWFVYKLQRKHDHIFEKKKLREQVHLKRNRD